MKPARRYALGTDVDVSKTRGEIEALLNRHGASQTMGGRDGKTRTGFVGFTMGGRQYRIPLLARPAGNRKPEQVEREQWRALLLVIRAKLEFISAGMTTAETEFLAHVVLPNGSTVGDELAPRLAEAYATGQVRGLLSA